MDNYDDLENALFNKNHTEKDSQIDLKKKVMFTDENEQSDGSYNSEDDFFKSHVEKQALTAKNDKLADLFKLNSENKTERDDVLTKKSPILSTKYSLEKLESQAISKEYDLAKFSNSTVNTTLKNHSKIKSVFDEDDNIIPNLTENKTKPSSTNQTKKSSFIEDLFGSRPKSSTAGDINKSSSIFDAPLTRSNTTESYTGSAENASKTTYSSGFSLSAPKEPRRGRRISTVQNDPLGLLASSTLQADEISNSTKQLQTSEVSAKPENLPEWLGGPKISKDQKQELEKTDALARQKLTETSSKNIDASTLPTALKIPVEVENVEQNGLTSKLLGMEFDQQAKIINLQQQEHELRTVVALSQQSEKLNYLLETQKVKLSEQEKQFNMLISRQMERQAILEAQMKAQQDRIDNYIQALSAQPSSIPSMALAVNKDLEKEDSNEQTDKKEESESLVQKLELEKIYLENTLDSLRDKHEKEVSILEDSYKKQITFLEEAMVQMEKRLQDDVDCIEADYKAKISKLKEEISEIEKTHKAEKNSLREENSKIIREIREQHFKNLEMLQKEHIESIERITKSKESERQAIEIMKVDGTNVQNILNKTHVIVEGLEKLQKKFENRDNTFVQSQDQHLLIQEKNIEYLKKSLEQQKDAFSEEKQKLMLTIQKLETDFSELAKEFQKQNASFIESEEIIKSRESALLRDREIFVEQTNWERERLQTLRDSWTKEQEMQLEWLFQERQALAAERAKYQVYSRLKIGGDDSSKVEFEATIKAAQDATTSANQERLKWQEKINELEVQKNALQDKESQLIQKAKELQELTQSALTKREEGLRALKEARFLEERYEEKYKQLQRQDENLTQRENKLVHEKLELAKERITMRVNLPDKPEKETFDKLDEGLSLGEDRSIFTDVPSSSHYTSRHKDIVDPNLVLLRWDLGHKMDISKKVLLATNQ